MILMLQGPSLARLLPILTLKSISGEVTAQEILKCPKIFLYKYERIGLSQTWLKTHTTSSKTICEDKRKLLKQLIKKI